MTNEQAIIKRFKQMHPQYQSTDIYTDLYGDIYRTDNKQQIAASDLPHSLDKIGNLLPQKWILTESEGET